ncbi:hypothetical protein ACFY4I_24310 [Streptomyces scabiei]|uniref:hypothetical protein n=1 Tax=Streptomyces scabiei TaxID=1930 RepID=UPI003689784D
MDTDLTTADLAKTLPGDPACLDLGVLAAVCARGQAHYMGRDVDAGDWLKAAAVLESNVLSRSHPGVDRQHGVGLRPSAARAQHGSRPYVPRSSDSTTPRTEPTFRRTVARLGRASA